MGTKGGLTITSLIATSIDRWISGRKGESHQIYAIYVTFFILHLVFLPRNMKELSKEQNEDSFLKDLDQMMKDLI